jgi:hypothetical protein
MHGRVLYKSSTNRVRSLRRHMHCQQTSTSSDMAQQVHVKMNTCNYRVIYACVTYERMERTTDACAIQAW